MSGDNHRSWWRLRAFLMLSPLAALLCACGGSGETPADSQAAESTLRAQSILGVERDEGVDGNLRFAFGPRQLSETKILPSARACEGAAGSVIRPMVINECTGSLFTAPIDIIENALLDAGAQSPNFRRVMLNNPERFWVHQDRPNDCWAAALEMTRGFVGLPHLSQEQILGSVSKECPALETQGGGANLYQIVYVISKLLNTTDGNAVGAHFCSDAQCIYGSLAAGYPLIMLSSNHAQLVVGIDYLVDPQQSDGKYWVVIKSFLVLDPAAPSPSVQRLSHYRMCKADAFITYYRPGRVGVR
jgi:hypothetical protein